MRCDAQSRARSFPGAAEIAAELNAAAVTKGPKGDAAKAGGENTKKEKKAKEAAALDGLLAAGLAGGPKAPGAKKK